MFIVIIILSIIALLWVYFAFIRLPIGCATMVNGGIKTGKTLLLVDKAIREVKKRRLLWFLFPWKRKGPCPVLYSNIPIKYKHFVFLTEDVLKRDVKQIPKNVTLINEMSLVANSMNYKDDTLNVNLEFFIKLFGHATKGGCLLIDTQALGDNHFAIKRSIDSTLWIERLINIPVLPFVIQRIRRMVVCNENTTNTIGDATEDLYTHIVWKSVFKKYDCYAYSYLTDNLPLYADEVDLSKDTDLKPYYIASFRKFTFDNPTNKEFFLHRTLKKSKRIKKINK